LSLPPSQRRRGPDPRWSDAEGERTARRILYGEGQAIDPVTPRRAIATPRRAVDAALTRRTST